LAPSLAFAVGLIVLSSVASLYSSWFTLQWSIALISFVQLVPCFLVLESPRWLIAVGRIKEAEEVIRKAAKMNGRELGTDWQLERGDGKGVENKNEEKYGMRHLFDKRILLFTLIQMLAWPAVALGYFGLSYGSSSMEGDFFVNSVILSVVELPAYIYAMLLIDLWGRKPVFSLSLTFTGIALIVSAFIENKAAKNGLIYVAKNTVSACFGIVFIYTAELLPTCVRSSGIGLCSLMARLGALFSPLLELLAGATSDQVPMFILGGFAVSSGLLTIAFLPETLGAGLPEDLEDIASLKTNSKSMWTCVKPKKRS